MAVFRANPLCPECGKLIDGIYSAPEAVGFVGDNFVKWDWEGHICSEPRKRLLKMAEELNIVNLVAALKNPTLQRTLEDIQKYGWVLCATSNPDSEEEVLVTDGVNIGLGSFDKSNKFSNTGWAVSGKGLSQFNIVAWIYKPELHELQACLNPKV